MTDNYLTGFKRITWRQSLWSSSSRLSGPHSATDSEQQCVACNEATLASLLHIRFNDSPVEFIKNVLCKKKLLLFLWGAIVIWPFAALNYSDSSRLALPRIAVGVELVTRALFAAWHAAASLIVDFRCLSFPSLSTCNTCHVRQCATPTATVKTADNAMATASVSLLLPSSSVGLSRCMHHHHHHLQLSAVRGWGRATFAGGCWLIFSATKSCCKFNLIFSTLCLKFPIRNGKLRLPKFHLT